MSVIILGEVSPGFVAQYGRQEYTVTGVAPHTRKSDGLPSVVITWRTSCRECDDEVSFTTGQSNVRFRPFCVECLRDGGSNAVRTRDRAAEREVTTVPDVMAVYRAVQAVQSVQMSMADNASRRLYAPAVLRSAAPDTLGHHTLAEIKAGILVAEARWMLMWDHVGRRRCGHVLWGYKTRPERWLRECGRWPGDGNVFN